MKVTVTLDLDSIAGELQGVCSENGITLNDLIESLLSSVADGSRRPGAWERSMLDSMGIQPALPEQGGYRLYYLPFDEDDEQNTFISEGVRHG